MRIDIAAIKDRLLCLLCILLTAMVPGKTRAQDEVFKNIEQQFKNFSDRTLQEKMYLHTDKNFYLTGEIIWFKLYNTDASFNKPLDISSVAYVEILDSINKPVQQAQIGLDKGEGNGSFYLSPGIASGNYKLRA